MRNKIGAAALAAAITTGSVLLGAPAASAAASCDSSGYTATGLPIERCTTLSNGILIHKKDNNDPTGLWTTYYKSAGSTITDMRLGYNLDGTTWYSSSFSISAGDTVSKSWSKAGSYMCYNSVGLLTYSGGTYQTPAAHC